MRTITQVVLLQFVLLMKMVFSQPLTMGFGKNLNLGYSDASSDQAFDFGPFPGEEIDHEDKEVLKDSLHISRNRDYIEVDVRNSKEKEVPGLRHLFCSGYYCAFQSASEY